VTAEAIEAEIQAFNEGEAKKSEQAL